MQTMNIETQKDLADQLLERGYKVTQATISRDIKELNLIKVQADGGAYKYTVSDMGLAANTAEAPASSARHGGIGSVCGEYRSCVYHDGQRGCSCRDYR